MKPPAPKPPPHPIGAAAGRCQGSRPPTVGLLTGSLPCCLSRSLRWLRTGASSVPTSELLPLAVEERRRDRRDPSPLPPAAPACLLALRPRAGVAVEGSHSAWLQEGRRERRLSDCTRTRNTANHWRLLLVPRS